MKGAGSQGMVTPLNSYVATVVPPRLTLSTPNTSLEIDSADATSDQEFSSYRVHFAEHLTQYEASYTVPSRSAVM